MSRSVDPGGIGRAVRDAPLAPLTTLELGGPARILIEPRSEGEVREALEWAESAETAVAVLGGGSNLVVGDGGFDGLVLRAGWRGVQVERAGDAVRVTAAAGEPWDEVVALAVEEGWAGLECLSGIPGTAGATPIQNVGAYGQDVSGAIASVRVLDRVSRAVAVLSNPQCGFAYRSSVFRGNPDRVVVLAVTFELLRGGPPTLRYPELVAALGGSATPTLAAVRRAVLDLRRAKSMLLEPGDPNRRSVGSFFLNPTLAVDEADEVAARARAAGVVADPSEVPMFPSPDGRVKLPAAWLVERAGFPKGTRRGPVGVSSRHALALVHHGGGSTVALLALAAEIQTAVRDRFGVSLRPEPTFLGCGAPDPLAP
ncbi:MAG: UDP-N-acetylmuramate dehydrogenase [Acidobacteriota bacterium]